LENEILYTIDIWSPEIILLLVLSGVLIGIINTLAGSGTAISYAIFMLLGLSPAYSNGSIRLGVVTQTLAAGINFHKKKMLNLKYAVYIAIPITLGSIVGAEIAVNINQELFKKVIGFAMIIMIYFLLHKPEKWIKERDEVNKNSIKWWHYLVYFLIGLYGGFIHIGVGIFLLAALVLMSGYDLVHANGLKVFIVFVYTPFALAIFMINGQIDYAVGLLSAVGNTIGGIWASNYAVKYGAKPLRWILIIVLILFTMYLFGFFDKLF
jgi:uncharacterized membrane protein YfcA